MFTTCQKNIFKTKTTVKESTKEINYLGWARWRKIYTIPSLQLRIDLEAVQGEENLGNIYCMKV